MHEYLQNISYVHEHLWATGICIWIYTYISQYMYLTTVISIMIYDYDIMILWFYDIMILWYYVMMRLCYYDIIKFWYYNILIVW